MEEKKRPTNQKTNNTNNINNTNNSRSPKLCHLPDARQIEVCAPQLSGLHDVIESKTSQAFQQAIWEAEMRTQVISKAPFQTTESTIRKSFQEQFCQEINDYISTAVEDIAQDHLDRRRFYIRYRSFELRKTVAACGFTIGTTQIPKEHSIFCGVIAKVPALFTVDIMRILLAKYGDIHEIAFVTYPGTSISTRRLFFSYKDIHPNQKVPESIVVDGIKMTIRDLRGRIQCSNCKKYGHKQKNCLAKDSGVSSQSSSEDEDETVSHPTIKKVSKSCSLTAPPMKEPASLSDVEPEEQVHLETEIEPEPEETEELKREETRTEETEETEIQQIDINALAECGNENKPPEPPDPEIETTISRLRSIHEGYFFDIRYDGDKRYEDENNSMDMHTLLTNRKFFVTIKHNRLTDIKASAMDLSSRKLIAACKQMKKQTDNNDPPWDFNITSDMCSLCVRYIITHISGPFPRCGNRTVIDQINNTFAGIIWDSWLCQK